jgi:MFS family permease
MRAYGRVLRVPRMRALWASAVLTRMPIGINGLAVVLFVRAETGSFSQAGAAAGGLALGSALGAPFSARLVDRFGTRVLLGLAGSHAALLGAIVALGKLSAPAPLLVAAAVLAGAALPPASSVLRSLYPRLLTGELVQTAYALDSVLTELIFVAGPALVALLVATVSPASALAVSAGAVLSGTWLFLRQLPEGAGRRAEGLPALGRLGALRSEGIRTLVFSMLPVGVAIGALEVALPAFADEHGSQALAGLLIVLWSIGSAAGGLIYGARPRRAPLARVHLQIALLIPLSLAPVALASSPLSMALLVIPAGLCIAPLIATRNELAGRVAPPGSETEAYTWPLTALVGGVAAGAAVAGALADGAGWRVAVLVAACSSALGATISLARRRSLVAGVRP